MMELLVVMVVMLVILGAVFSLMRGTIITANTNYEMTAAGQGLRRGVRATLDGVDARDGVGIARIASQAVYRFGRQRDDVTGAQCLDGGCNVFGRSHTGILANAERRTPNGERVTVRARSCITMPRMRSLWLGLALLLGATTMARAFPVAAIVPR